LRARRYTLILSAINIAKNQGFPQRLRFALAGIAHALRHEGSLRFQALALVAVLIVLAIGHLAPIWWALVVLTSAGVLAAELFNTAIEHLADHLHPEVHPQIRVVKDCAAAAVLLMSCGAIGIAIALGFELLRSHHWHL
jgi:diacylglycerol kinase (ATP)